MRLLLDHNLPRKLRNHLSPHQADLTGELKWDALKNGQLLAVAQQIFDVLLTADANIYHQQKVASFNIAVIVLRAYDNSYDSLHPPDVLNLMEAVQPGKVYYIYVDEKLKESDRRKGKGPEAE